LILVQDNPNVELWQAQWAHKVANNLVPENGIIVCSNNKKKDHGVSLQLLVFVNDKGDKQATHRPNEWQNLYIITSWQR
jgi:hypothetical protein